MAVRFSAIGQHFTRNTGPAIGGPWTIAAWVKASGLRTAFSTLCYLAGGGGEFQFFTNSDGLSIAYYDGGSVTNFDEIKLVAGQYRYLGLVKAGTGAGQLRLWHGTEGNGNLAGSSTFQSAATGTPDVFDVGTAVVYGEWFDGSIAALKIWTAALTQQELEAEKFTRAAQRTQDLWGEYWFKTLSGADSSGNGRHLSGGVGAALDDDPEGLEDGTGGVVQDLTGVGALAALAALGAPAVQLGVAPQAQFPPGLLRP